MPHGIHDHRHRWGPRPEPLPTPKLPKERRTLTSHAVLIVAALVVGLLLGLALLRAFGAPAEVRVTALPAPAPPEPRTTEPVNELVELDAIGPAWGWEDDPARCWARGYAEGRTGGSSDAPYRHVSHHSGTYGLQACRAYQLGWDQGRDARG